MTGAPIDSLIDSQLPLSAEILEFLATTPGFEFEPYEETYSEPGPSSSYDNLWYLDFVNGAIDPYLLWIIDILSAPEEPEIIYGR